MKRKMTSKIVTGRKRIYRVVKVTKRVLQCERPYVLFGAAVREARLAAGLTQQELSDRLQYTSRASIANIEVGRQRVLLSDVFDFAKALKIKPQSLFEAVQQ